jgi:hypothetical protein
MDTKQAEKHYSVCQFFEDNSYEYVRRYVDSNEAVFAFNHYTTSVGAQIGTTRRVIITDGGDLICLEWEFGKGITFPSPAPDSD